jgi:uncharacterized membrane protein
MRLVSRLAAPAAVAALATAALAIPAGPAHAEQRECLRNGDLAKRHVDQAAIYAGDGWWTMFQSEMADAYEAAGGYCAPGQIPDRRPWPWPDD